ncbi:hypothetical protein HUW46_06648 [Amycolatopsis sp. CA-230715]|nr:hypothetical protein HUW46_06648 [Amycolatopsis sp. CA-230715]
MNGEPSPRNIEYVITGRYALSRTDGSRPAADDPTYFVQMTGDFVNYYARTPRGSKAPRGTVLTVMVDVATGRMLGQSLGSAPHDLSRLGTVRTLP